MYSDDVREQLLEAARNRDSYELRRLAREDRYEVGHVMRHEGRVELSPGEREYAAEVFREAGVDLGW